MKRNLSFTLTAKGIFLSILILLVQTMQAQSLRFNDTGYVDLGNNAALKLTNFTLEAWIKIEGYGSTTQTGGSGDGLMGVVPIVTKGISHDDVPAVDINYFMGYRLSDNKLIADFEDDASSGGHPVISNASLPTCGWVHVAVSYNTSTDTWKMYINGVLDRTLALGGNFTPRAASNINACIGSSLNFGPNRPGFFNGRIDEVRIWNVVRTDAEVSSNYNSQLTSGTGLVGRWGLNEGSGTTVANSGSAGSAANGTIVNGPLWVSGYNQSDPATAASVDFDGTNDYITMGNGAGLNATSFTLEAWIRIEGAGITTSTGTGGVVAVPIVSKGRSQDEAPANINVNYFLGLTADNRLAADFEEGTGPNHPVTGVATIPTNTWTHVAATYSQGTGTWKLYINGAVDQTLALGSNFTPANTSVQHAAIATAMNTSGAADGYFNGRIDEVRIWNIVRSDADISGNMNNEFTTAAGMIGRWGLNEGTGTTASNSGSAGGTVNGTLTNGPVWINSGFAQSAPSTGASVDFNGAHDFARFGSGLTATSFTLEAWIKVEGSGITTNTGSGGVIAVPIITKGRSESDAPANINVNYFLGLTADNKLAADFEEGAGANHPVTGSGTIPTNAWTHVAATYTQSTGTWRLYINGALDQTLALGSNFTPANTSIHDVCVGTAMNSTDLPEGYFHGKIDEVRIWNTARSDANILANYQSELTSGTGLIGRWGFNENCGTTVGGSAGGSGTLVSNNIATHYTNGGPVWHSSGYNRAPLQPANINPPDGQMNFSGNSVNVTVTDPEAKAMTVKLFGRKKTATASPNFTIIPLPDTQFYTNEPQGGNGAYQNASNAIFKAQTQWIADNRVARNIVFVSQLGDCTNNGQAFEVEWKRADTSMKKIENPAVPIPHGIPYSICVGNHDQGNAAGDPQASTGFYNQYFGEARFLGRPYYGGHYGNNNDNHFSLFSASGIDFIHIALEYNNNSGGTNQGILQNVLGWADSLLKAHPNRKGIVSSHWIMEIGTNAAFGGPGSEIYNQLKDNPNFLLMLCGHRHGEGRRTDLLNNGQPVHTILSDYQGRVNGGDGWMRIMEFSPSTNTVSIKTYSPTLNQFETDADSEFTLPVDLLPGFTLIATNGNVPSGSATDLAWAGLLPGTEYEWYVTIDDGESVTTSAIFDFKTAGALPVNLLNIRAVNEKERVKLEWTTTSEINTARFEVEHAPDGRNFTKIGEVKAANNSTINRNYYLYDEMPFPTISYYRLKMFDNDGHFTYSKTVHVTRGTGKFAVMPNPVSRNEIRVITERLPNGNAQVRVYDQAGRVQMSQMRVVNGQPLILTHRLSAGMYFIEIEMKGLKETQTFIVQ